MNMFDQHNSTVDYAQVRHHLTAPVRVLINHRPMLSKRMPSAYPVSFTTSTNILLSNITLIIYIHIIDFYCWNQLNVFKLYL